MAIKKYVVVSVIASAAMTLACAGTPKVSEWKAPTGLAYDRVFAAALRAIGDNGFTVVNNDTASGTISAKKQEYGGDKMVERYINVQVKRAGGKIMVSSKASGSDFGVIEGLLGGAVNKEVTNNFYVYLFRQLNLTDPALRQVVITNER